ncbi:MAG TPA: hypothetical protein VEX86_11280 [Longimicrobium sp.]|nr:hypothetical protein [Longimicrobium sp.]
MRLPNRRPSPPAFIASAALVLALLSCAIRPAAAQERERTLIVGFRGDVPRGEHPLGAPPERVAEALRQVYAEVGLPLVAATGRPNDYFTPYLQVRGRLFGRPNTEFFACQEDSFGGNLAVTGLVTFAILVQLRPENDGTTVMLTQMDARANRRNVTASPVECGTTGKLEAALVELVEQRLRAPAPAP